MALDATIGTETANSYVTLSEAEDYFYDRVYASESWSAFNDQEKVLITCSNVLDWYMKWKGSKASSIQSMEWPRAGVVLPDGTPVDNTVIPQKVKVAVFELALSFLEEDRTADNPLFGLEQVKLSSLMVKADLDSALPTSKEAIPERVKKIVSDLCSNFSINVIRLVRA